MSKQKPQDSSNQNRTKHRTIAERGRSRRYPTAENHRQAVERYRNRAVGRPNKAPKAPPDPSKG